MEKAAALPDPEARLREVAASLEEILPEAHETCEILGQPAFEEMFRALAHDHPNLQVMAPELVGNGVGWIAMLGAACLIVGLVGGGSNQPAAALRRMVAASISTGRGDLYAEPYCWAHLPLASDTSRPPAREAREGGAAPPPPDGSGTRR